MDFIYSILSPIAAVAMLIIVMYLLSLVSFCLNAHFFKRKQEEVMKHGLQSSWQMYMRRKE